MARARRAGRPADAGDQAHRRRRAGDGVRDGRLPAGPPRRGPLERRGHRGPGRAADRRRGHELRRRAGPRLGAGRASAADVDRRGLRPVRRGPDGRGDRATASGVVSLYAPNGRVVGSPVLHGQAAPGSSGWRAGSRESRDRLATPLVLGGDLNVAPTDADVWDADAGAWRHARLRAGARGLPRAPATRPGRRLPVRPRGAAADSRGGTTGRACSTRTSGCGSTTCS